MMSYKKLFFLSSGILGFILLSVVWAVGIQQWDKFQEGAEKRAVIASFKGLSEEERSIVFGSMSEFTTEEEVNNYNQLVSNLALESDFLAIDNCTLFPPVLKSKPGEIIEISNDGDVGVILDMNGIKYVISSKGKLRFMISRDNSSVVLGYSCQRIDGVFEPSRGLIVLPGQSGNIVI